MAHIENVTHIVNLLAKKANSLPHIIPSTFSDLLPQKFVDVDLLRASLAGDQLLSAAAPRHTFDAPATKDIEGTAAAKRGHPALGNDMHTFIGSASMKKDTNLGSKMIKVIFFTSCLSCVCGILPVLLRM